jgi:hypothetical protein
VQYVLEKANHIHKRETHPLIRENVTQGLDRKGSAAAAEKNILS